MNEGPPTRWDRFVIRHRHRGNLLVHAISAALYFGGPLLALALWSPWPLAGFAVSGLVGAAGHFLFHDGGVDRREATFAAEVPGYVLLMFWRILLGRYGEDVALAEARLAVPPLPGSPWGPGATPPGAGGAAAEGGSPGGRAEGAALPPGPSGG